MTHAFPALLDSLLDGHTLPSADAEAVMDDILLGGLGPERLAAFVTAMRARDPAVDELVGFASSMRKHAKRIDAGTPVVVDNCGTGGAAHKAFNISTTAAFVLAAGGLTVAKHGNRSVTRPSGSADVLERCGARLDLAPEQVEKVLRQEGIAFLFAPAFHPAMRHAGPVRQALGIKTVFNLLGPLTNPAGATHQVLGVYDPAYVPLIGRALAHLGCTGGYVVHGEPGFDEATPCGPVSFVRVARKTGHGPVDPGTRDVAAVDASTLDTETLDTETLDPESLGLAHARPGDLAAVPGPEAPAKMRALLRGRETGAAADAVALNAALMFHAAGTTKSIEDGLAEARRILADGHANEILDAFIAATQAA
jgi:anthranilate phosphoribosyltransferase